MRATRSGTKFLLLCIIAAPGVLALAFTALFVNDEIAHRPMPGDHLVRGVVIARGYDSHWTGARRPCLRVQAIGGGPIVCASLVNDRIDSLPDLVSFYYSGDPRREVRLLEERENIGAMICLCCLTLTVYGVLFLCLPPIRASAKLKPAPADPE